MTWVWGGITKSVARPTATILFFRMATIPFGRGAAPVPSMTTPFLRTSASAGTGWGVRVGDGGAMGLARQAVSRIRRSVQKTIYLTKMAIRVVIHANAIAHRPRPKPHAK